MSDNDTPTPDEPEPFALTEANLRALEKAIRAEGFDILVDPQTGEIKLKRGNDV